MVEMANISNQINKNSKKRFRKLPLVGGLFTLYICFFANIPLGLISNIIPMALSNISLNIMSINQLDYYIWGILDSASPIIDYSNITLESLIPLSIWLMALISGILGIVGSSYKADPKKMKRLILIAAVLLITDLTYFGSLYFILTISLSSSLGIGFFAIFICLGIYVIAATRITEYREK